MKRILLAAVAAVAALLVLVGCGPAAEDDESATDPTPPPSETTTPTAEPTVGTYPDFAPDDYSYTLRVNCFCPDAGEPVRIRVVAGEAVDAVYLEDGRAVTAGDPAPEFRRLTIDEVIEAANDTEADLVKVKWPEGQDYPSGVYVDQDKLMVDEEVGYLVSDVVVD
ncbi:MAG: DUF6174 domain-containing protein [Nocardioides sp.]|nr:DUF6174 domain-containing protein [Nocardioides sp.]